MASTSPVFRDGAAAMPGGGARNSGDIAEGLRLLVVDDDRIQRLLVGEVGRRVGYVVDEAASVEEAVQRLAEQTYCRVVVDLSLGTQDGVEVIRRIASSGQRPAILVISGFDSRIRDAAMRFGQSLGLAALGELRKPLNVADLRAALSQKVGTTEISDKPYAASSEIKPEHLRTALAIGEVRPFYQPKVNLRTGRIAGVEALARWSSSLHGDVPPIVFVELADRWNLAFELTTTMLRNSLSDLARWRAAGHEIGLAVNVPAHALGDLDLPDFIEDEIARVGVPPGSLTIEVTETTAMSDAVASGDVLTRLRIKGVQISLDDFGTGYSSLASLLRMPFSELKIDRSFVQACDTDPFAWKIVRASLSLAREFGMKAVAEGIETASVADMLRQAQCDEAQGYLFSRAVPMEKLLEKLDAQG
jgi:EAL domain-containing protein (putative c-di-GMP-specific phosphodiesterase class I)/CheY-like chemotaxis protein